MNPYQLERIESKLDHVHELLHGLIAIVLKSCSGMDDAAVAVQIEKLRASAAALSSAVAANQHAPTQKETTQVANPLLDALAAQVKQNTDAEASAVTLINGFAARMDAAIQAALAGGATAAELQPIQAEVDALHASADALAAAVTANTPAQAAKKKP